MDNDFEQFEKRQIEREIKIKHEFEKINAVESKLSQEYGEYKILRSFVSYLSSIEKVFAQARIYNSSHLLVKEEIVKTEMHFFSEDNRIDEKILNSIKDDFGSVYMAVSQIYAVAEKLLQKFSDNPDCIEFIKSLRDIHIIFAEAHDKKIKINEIQEQIYRSHMKILTEDGDPEISVLEKIYRNFEKELEIIKNDLK